MGRGKDKQAIFDMLAGLQRLIINLKLIFVKYQEKRGLCSKQILSDKLWSNPVPKCRERWLIWALEKELMGIAAHFHCLLNLGLHSERANLLALF